MSIVCDACETSNRDTAMFCIGCAGRLPGFAPSGPSMLEAVRRGSPETRIMMLEDAGHAAGRPQDSDSRQRWLWLGAGGLLLIVGLMAWGLQVGQPESVDPERPLASASVATAPLEPSAVPPPSPPGNTPTIVEAPVASQPAETVATVPAPAPAPAPLLADASPPPVPSLQPDAPPALPSSGPSSEASTRAVEQFYAALAVGDGSAAAALITPAKRGTGAFSETGMTKFYRSLRDPLALRSVRTIGRGMVEARYRYRATVNACEGRAVIWTEAVGSETLIRRISANC